MFIKKYKQYAIAILLIFTPLTTNAQSNQNLINISEIFPNPQGQDQGKEWIEIHNPNNQIIDLSNWNLSINNSQIKLDDLSINPNTYLILNSNQLKKSIKNSDTKILLKSPQGQIIQEIEYNKSHEGLSFSKVKIIQNKNSRM